MSRVASLVERARRAPPWAADSALAVAIFAIGVVEILFFAQKDLVVEPFRVAAQWSIPLFAVMSLPLVMRRRNLWAAYLLIETAAVVAGQSHLVVAYGLGALLVFNVLLYSVAEQNNALVTTVLTLGQVGFFYSLEFEVPTESGNRTALLDDSIFYLPFFSFAAFAGWAQRRRRRLTAELKAREIEVQRERELLAAQAVAQERIRIARELRALVLQGVDRMTTSAVSARRDVESHPDRSRAEIAAIETAGRRTLVEMRRLLGVLRRSDQARDESVPADLEAVAADGIESGREFAAPQTPRLFDQPMTWAGRPWLIDVAVVLALGGLAALEFLRADPSDRTMQGWPPRGFAALIVLALLFRRRAPFAVLTLVASTEFAWILLRDNAPGSADRALLVAVYTVAAHKDIRWGMAAVGMGVFAWSPLPVQSLCICLIDIGTLSAFAMIAGHSILVGRRINRELKAQTELLRRTRQERVQFAVARERTRVAREMHDVVAHAVTGMVVQAGGARMVATDDPRLAAATLEDVQQMGQEALQELRTLVEALDPPATPSRAEVKEETPDVGSLIERARRAGQDVSFSEDGEARVDQGLQISVYRIVQEALTNVRKHAPGARAAVAIRYESDAVEVEVTNDAASTAEQSAAVPGAGQGLIGIRERASVFGGSAEAAPTPAGGYRLTVHLPLELVPA